ncbi:peptidyl-prolyl cis-trans isomerase [Neisseria gonorrhoeae]|uniref:Peptidyl-prolyl cis-trans isomerase n=1 Tax=Neisseria gonorrhoeae TaxID=485 RepID=A0A378VZ09_NEIGO|nr:peptidyl-prolyl cis-trans isomerase [Neisseria gonorrhoeae]
MKNAFEERVARLPAHEAKPSFEQEKAAVENELKMKRRLPTSTRQRKAGRRCVQSSLLACRSRQKQRFESGNPRNLAEQAGCTNVRHARKPNQCRIQRRRIEEKHNSEVLTINSETAWVVRAKEVREEKTYCLKKPKMRCVRPISVPKPPNLPKTRQKKCLPN